MAEKECWCGKRHGRGDVRNGEMKHYVINWKLYELRGGEIGEDGHKAKAEVPASKK